MANKPYRNRRNRWKEKMHALELYWCSLSQLWIPHQDVIQPTWQTGNIQHSWLWSGHANLDVPQAQPPCWCIWPLSLLCLAWERSSCPPKPSTGTGCERELLAAGWHRHSGSCASAVCVTQAWHLISVQPGRRRQRARLRSRNYS